MKQKLEIKNINSSTVLNLIKIKKPRFVRISSNRISKFNRFLDVYTTKYQIETFKNLDSINFFFHWLEIEQIMKILIEISKIELSIKKIYI